MDLKSSRFGIAEASRGRERAHTLVELMVAMSVFSLVVLAVIYAHLFGLKMYGIVHAKVDAGDNARRTINRITEEIKTAGIVRVGEGDEDSFVQTPVNTLQKGNALRIFPVADDTNTFVQYFYDSGDQSLKRIASGEGAPVVIAQSVTNQTVFASEDFKGNVLTNNFNNRVISMHLQFSQEVSGVAGLHDFYQLRTKITRRALE